MRQNGGGHFEGWYYKQQSHRDTLALIAGKSDEGAFVQVITAHASYHAPYALEDYRRVGQQIQIGGSTFSPDGLRLNIYTPDLTLTGALRYGPLAPIRGDIMGPFRFFPMECCHGICSMHHAVDGQVLLGGQTLDFTDGVGYIERDSGRSFPTEYMWVHCNDFASDCSILASVARIPFAGLHFWGCIAVVWLRGQEYRLATYRGASIARCDKAGLTITQGRLTLEIALQSDAGHALYAPDAGAMRRTIRECAACPARFRLSSAGATIFEGASNRASCEYVMGR